MIEHDEWGPELIYEVYDPKKGYHGFTVIDNLALGVGKGGIRMTPSVSVEEVFRLARTMTWKNAMAGLPFGGAKSGIVGSKGESLEERKKKVQWFGKALRPICPSIYIAGPDVSTTEREMGWFAKANGTMKASTGKPKRMGGIPHELGSTGFGVFHSTLIALKHLGMKPKTTKFAIEGFGNVGMFVAKFLSGVKGNVVAVSDSKGVIYNENGIKFNQLKKIKEKTGSVINYKPGNVLKNEKLFELPIDVIISAALPDSINQKNVNKIKAKIVVEGGNITMQEKYEEILHKRNILVVPDFVANAGGVISSYIEWKGGTPKQMFRLVENKIKRNTKSVLDHAKKERISPRKAALEITEERVKRAMQKRNL
jgi:glutamate dehydrogenase/leucine dehydrogenase